ncbi:MAG: hypothetical protein INH41_31520 [Myxococcaceae bacterium]|nr:hypothetical protein [Myxococcaceae bacterium]
MRCFLQALWTQDRKVVSSPPDDADFEAMLRRVLRQARNGFTDEDAPWRLDEYEALQHSSLQHHSRPRPRRPTRRLDWASLHLHAFGVDVLRHPWGGRRRAHVVHSARCAAEERTPPNSRPN